MSEDLNRIADELERARYAQRPPSTESVREDMLVADLKALVLLIDRAIRGVGA